ncbi:CGLD27 family protein [Cyanobium sp. Morenito 9A2]|uniref:CGLD27 family protein n=1 Tax=Cyanobium sp. Morenito 9A2 TaxID=2823718 RepID=UPI0020CE6BC2|nr:CGLD27 family protein [Cyanobium sp. Morenito 9A2]MCP9851186.1 CGLD27 family protein [Cyanobium sp. Morenito 9A2]
MAEDTLTDEFCPVPPEQRPLEEYGQFCRSWFFRWPASSAHALLRPLLVSWWAALPLSLLVSSGSWALRQDPLRLTAIAVIGALLLPLALLVRQWLGWRHLLLRLLNERIAYEESGWYDGQEWDKPLAWRQRDLLVARHQVGPVMRRLERSLALMATLLLFGTALCQAF